MSRIIERRISFNGGEISPWTDPRLDLEKYRTSCRLLENMRPAVYGGAFSRAGTVFAGEQLDQAHPGRLVAFEFSATTNLILEFTDLNMRVWTSGELPGLPQVALTPLEHGWTNSPARAYPVGEYVLVPPGYDIPYRCVVAHTASPGVPFATYLGDEKWVAQTDFQLVTPYAHGQLNELQFVQQNDLVFITHPEHPPHVLSRFADNKWTLKPIVQEYPATRDENITANNITATGTLTTGGTVTLDANSAVFQAGHVGSRWVIKHRRQNPLSELLLSASVGAASPGLFVLGAWSLTVNSGSGTSAWEAIGVVERSDRSTGGSWETVRTMTASRIDRSGIITGTEIEPCYLRVRLFAKTGTLPANGQFTLEAVNPDHHGIVEITSYSSPVLAGAKVIFELAENTPTKRWLEAAWSSYRGWPRAVCLHEGRLILGGNAHQPQTFWGSVIDDYYNFRTGSDDDLGLAFTLSGQKANAIQWLISQEALIVGTGGAEGPVGARESDKALTPANAKTGRFSNIGSAFIQALPVQDTVIFVQRGGRKAWEYAFAFESDGFKANDLTLLAEHIVDGGIVQVALQKNPETVLWFVTAAGQLVGLAYERGQRVTGWFRHVTEGTYESVAVVSGQGEEDQVWVTVLREGGRFIERFQPEHMRLMKDGAQAELCKADAAVIYSGTAATVIGGLGHLEGQEVCILAEGSPVPPQVVAGGEIVLAQAATRVIVGLPFTASLQPTFLETNDPASVSKVAWKRIHRVTVELWKSLGLEVSADDGETWEPVPFTEQGALMDTAVPWFSGVKEVAVESRSERQVAPILRQRLPLPLNVQSLHVWHEMNVL